MTTSDQRRALALRIAKTIGRDPQSRVTALRSRLDTSFKFNPHQPRDPHTGEWIGHGHGGKEHKIEYDIAGKKGSLTGRIIRERHDSVSVVKRGRPESATEIIQKQHITNMTPTGKSGVGKLEPWQQPGKSVYLHPTTEAGLRMGDRGKKWYVDQVGITDRADGNTVRVSRDTSSSSHVRYIKPSDMIRTSGAYYDTPGNIEQLRKG